MKKILITGFSGFVSYHFLEYINTLSEKFSVVGLDINEPDFDISSFHNITNSYQKVNLLDKAEIEEVVKKFQPNFILHLASYSSVAYSWQNPAISFANNTNIFLNLLEAVRSANVKCRVLSIGSSEEYGNVPPEAIPISERQEVQPLSPYAVARVSQEMLSKVYVQGFNMDIVLTRSFNHIGTRQKDVFVVSSFVKKITDIKKNNYEPVIATGDLSIIRDFLDVRDVVKAYYALLLQGKKGETYNVCSGIGISLNDVITMISENIGIDIRTITNPEFVRPNDNKVIIGDNSKIHKEIGWKPQYSLKESLHEIIKYWEGKS